MLKFRSATKIYRVLKEKDDKQLWLILNLLLFPTCGIFASLTIGYGYICHLLDKGKNQYALLFFLINSCVCFFLFILTGILLGVGWKGKIMSADLVLWVSENDIPERDNANIYRSFSRLLVCSHLGSRCFYRRRISSDQVSDLLATLPRLFTTTLVTTTLVKPRCRVPLPH